MSIKVLSWNISWGSMTGKSADTTAMPLPSICNTIKDPQGINQCLNNVIELIDNSAKTTKYDFVALQEASKWFNIYQKI
jgi:hypothetical protein